VVEFGRPISVPEELVEQYKIDKRGAVEKLMHLIEDAMRTLRPGAENYDELQAIITMRALWKPADRKLTPEESVKITRTFALGIKKFKNDERVIQALREVEDYNKALKAVGCVDRDVQMNYVTDTVKLCRAAQAFATVIILLLPTAVLSLVIAPVAYVTWKTAMREKQAALAGSSVKVKALDVVASQKVKVALLMVPIYALILNCLLVWFSSGGWKTFLFLSLIVTPMTISFGVRICDLFWEAVAHCHSFTSSRRSRSMLEERTQLQKKIRALVEELGPHVVDDFSSKRTFSAEELARDSTIVDSVLAKSPSNENNECKCKII
jgi:glycerol-3-phosphate O-acyltransferase/dihydroxyacetone phosphate acyltransferase